DGPPSANIDAENDAEMLGALAPLARAVRNLLPLLRDPAHRDALEHDLAQLAIHVGAQSARAPLRAIRAAAADGDAARIGAEADARLADAVERDGRALISVWGEQHSGLHDYSARHWSGSLTDLHLTRWRVWTDWLAAGARAGTEPDPEPLRAEIRRVE